MHLLTEIMRVISALNVGCAPGPDGLEGKFIKLDSWVFIFSLADLFNLPLSSSKLPSIWKCAKATQLNKRRDPLDIYYRLIDKFLLFSLQLKYFMS